jgi:hypothetical protein
MVGVVVSAIARIAGAPLSFRSGSALKGDCASAHVKMNKERIAINRYFINDYFVCVVVVFVPGCGMVRLVIVAPGVVPVITVCDGLSNFIDTNVTNPSAAATSIDFTGNVRELFSSVCVIIGIMGVRTAASKDFNQSAADNAHLGAVCVTVTGVVVLGVGVVVLIIFSFCLSDRLERFLLS